MKHDASKEYLYVDTYEIKRIVIHSQSYVSINVMIDVQ